MNGPFSKEEKVVWDKFRALKEESKTSIEEMRKELLDPMCDYKEILESEIAYEQRIYDSISKHIKD